MNSYIKKENPRKDKLRIKKRKRREKENLNNSKKGKYPLLKKKKN